MRVESNARTLLSPDESTARATAPTGRDLIVDDEPNVRFVFRTALEAAGYTVDEASDGIVALARVKAFPTDVMLLDLQMPEMGGMEVLQQLRDAGDDTRVIIVTAHGGIPDAVAAMKLGAIDFLAKPLTPEALRRVVSEVIARHAPSKSNPRSTTPTAEIAVGPIVFDLTPVKQALNRREFDRAGALLEEALDTDPDSAEALTLMGVLLESRGRDHAAYHSYRSALTSNPGYGPARDNMRRYCERVGLDYAGPAINPATRR